MSKSTGTEPAAGNTQQLRVEYDRERARASRLLSCIRDEITTIIERENITLGVPIEARVKNWLSIEEKLQRKSLKLQRILDLQDLVGLRLILLFRRDLEKIDKILHDNFDVQKAENVGERLAESQFGYQSQHYLMKLKDEWLAVPRYNDLGGLTAEVQIRTLAQHMWAAASHSLQYKREQSVPVPLRRTIYRVSALLETVDLELDRVLAERLTYIASEESSPTSDASLNVDLVNLISREMFPEANYDPTVVGSEEVLREIEEFGINNSDELRRVIQKQMNRVLAVDKDMVSKYGDSGLSSEDRISRGAYFTHVGLLRQTLVEEFGEDRMRSVMKKLRTGGMR